MPLDSLEFASALLADAAYADNLATGMSAQQLKQALSLNLTPTLAVLISTNFEVISHIETSDLPVVGSGFDGTVWRGRAGSAFAGRLFLSIQGTGGASDFLSDLKLALAGDAGRQTLDMVNWWLRITGSKQADVPQVEYVYNADRGTYDWMQSFAPGEGLISAEDRAAGVEVVGHSLGGYLATAFTRLLGQQANVLHTSTFNSAGFAAGSEAAFQELQARIGTSLGIGRFPGRTEQSNYFAVNGPNFTTNTFWFEQIGARQEVYNEQGALPTSNHSMYKLTDSLALFAAMSKLDPELSLAHFNEIVAAGSNQSAGSLEGVLDVLRRTFLDRTATALPISDAETSPDRDVYEAALVNFQDSSAFASLGDSMSFEAVGTNLVARAETRADFQTITALETLGTFIVNPGDAQAQAALESSWQGLLWRRDYEAWVADLASLNAGGEPENFTNEYLADRSLLLANLLKRNKEDVSGSIIGSADVGTDRVLNLRYREPSALSDSTLTVWNPALNGGGIGLSRPPQLIAFGTGQADTINGSDETIFGDHLYGGDGDDTINALDGDDHVDGGLGDDLIDGAKGFDILRGGQGDDVLTGGEGHDVLAGGSGIDSYMVQGATGLDTIRDADGSGIVYVGTKSLRGGGRVADDTWLSDDGQITYVLAGGNLVVRPGAGAGSSGVVTIEEWDAGDLGITLSDDPAPVPEPANTLIGDFVKLTKDDGANYALGPDGQYVPAGQQPGAQDLLTGTSASDLIEGRGGDDALLGMDGDDVIDGGDGNDVLMGGLGADRLIGGAGRDLIFGSSTGGLQYPVQTSYRLVEPSYAVVLGEGFNWRLSSPGLDADGFQHGFLSDTVARETQPGDQANVIDAGSDDDMVYAGSGNDVVHAGTGDDQVMGLAGDDAMFGDDGNDRMYGDGPTNTTESIVYTPAAQHGNDVLIGGAGDDLLIGQGGNDVLYGEADDDILYGDDRLDPTLAGEDYLDGGDGQDALYGGAGDDILIGGAGDDILHGGAGRDIYVFNRGDGSDVIDDTGHDSVLRLGPGVTRDDIALGLGSLLVGFGGGDQVHLQGFDPLDARASAPIGTIEFSDGTTLGTNELLDLGFDIDGTANANSLQGTSVGDRVRGFEGADQITSFGGDDMLDGGTGDDVLDAGDGNDILIGGAGNDILRGAGGDDIYQFALGSGHDLVDDAAGANAIEFGGGIDPTGISADLVDGSLVVATAAGDTITIGGAIGQYRFADGTVLTNDDMLARVPPPDTGTPPSRVDGTNGNDTLTGGPGDDVLIGAGGDDVLDGAAGADMLFGDDGDDVLHGGDGSDVLAGGAGPDTLYGEAGADRLWGQDGNDALYGGPGADELSGGAGEDLLVGGPGNDILIAGGTGAKTFRFDVGDGDDTIAFAGGARHIEFGPGILRSNIQLFSSPADAGGSYVGVRYSATDSVMIQLGAGAGTLDYRFADGSVVSHSVLAATVTQTQRAPYVILGTPGDDTLFSLGPPTLLDGGAGNDVIDGAGADDVLRGGSGNDSLRGRDGNDTLVGGLGDDLLAGGQGDDVYLYARGDGSDIIAEESGGADVLRFSDVDASDVRYTRESSGSLLIHIAGSSETIEIRDWFANPPSRLQQLVYADGTVVGSDALNDVVQASITSTQPGLPLTGTEFDDVIVGSAAGERIEGREGNDLLTGGGGSDVYSLRWRMGMDTVVETGAESNVLQLEAGVELEHLVFKQDGADLVVALESSSNGVRLKNYYAGGAQNWLVRGLDGSQTAVADLLDPRSRQPVLSSIEDMRAAWLADGERYYAAAFTDPSNGAGPNDTVSFSELSSADDVRDMYRESDQSESISSGGWVMVEIQVPDYRYDVQDLEQGRLLIRDFRQPDADGQPTAHIYNPDEGVQLDWIGNFDTRPPVGPMRTINVKVPSPAGEFHINVESITGGAASNSIGTEGFGAVDAGPGDDVIWGMWALSNDYEPGQFLYGGGGNDFVMGGFGKDMVIGGPGDDYLAGSAGPDTYFLVAGDAGTKVIDEAAKYWTVPGVFHRDESPSTAYNTGYQDDFGFYRGDRPRNDDAVVFGAGITLDQLQVRRGHYTSPYSYDAWSPDPADREFDTLDFAWGDGQLARVLLQQPSPRASAGDGTGIELFRFADGSTFTMTQMQALVDSRNANTITLWRGDGPRSLALSAEKTSVTIGPGIVAADVAFARDASDLVLSLSGTTDEWRLLGWFDEPARLSSFSAIFADGTRWTPAQLALPNRPPQAHAISSQTAVEDQPWTFRIADGAFSDPDAGDVLAWSVQAAAGAVLPDWLHFDANTRTFSGTPSNNDVGQVTLEVTARDRSGAAASSSFEVSVLNVNDAPVAVAAIGQQQAAETRAFAFALPADLFFDDDAADVMTLSMTQANGQPLPGWMTFDAEHGLVHGQPQVGDGGTWALLVTATDASGAVATQSFELVVSHAPVVAAPLHPAPALEDSAWSFTIPDGSFVDADQNDTLVFATTSLDGGPLPAWLTFDATSRTFSGTPTNDDVGLRALRVTVTDTSGASAVSAFGVEVVNVNDAPVALHPIADQQALEDAQWRYAIAPGTFVDSDAGDRLAYSARLASGDALPAWLHFDADAAAFAGAPGNDDVGTLQLTVTATDSSGAAADGTFTLRVVNVNDAPIAVGTLSPWTVVAGEAVAYSIPPSAFTDVDAGDHLSLSATLADGRPLPTWMKFDAPTRTLSGSPSPGDAGDLLLRLLATDTTGATASQALAIQVKPGLTLQGGSGSDTLTGHGGNDVLNGGAGADRMIGGAGDDTYFVSETGDIVVELTNEGVDAIHSAVSYTLPANVEQLFLDGSARGSLPPLPILPARAMVPGLTGTGNALDNLLVGNAENNVLTGGGGNDTLDGRAGNDTLIGGSGSDRYLVGRGAGRDTVEENDATPGNTDVVLFGPDVRSDQLWFRKHGNDLDVSIVGGDDLLTVSNWYKGSQYHVEQFRTADGKVLLDSRVQQLVDAMASFSPPAIGQTSVPAAYQQQLTPVLAANWH
jgi:Ca2+-binding RTX toxin-like protein